PLEAADEHAEPGRVEELDLLHVDDEVVATVLHQLDDLLPKLWCGIDVDLSADGNHRLVAFVAGHEREVHSGPLGCAVQGATGRGLRCLADSTTQRRRLPGRRSRGLRRLGLERSPRATTPKAPAAVGAPPPRPSQLARWCRPADRRRTPGPTSAP